MRLNRNYIAPFAFAVFSSCLITPEFTQAKAVKSSFTKKYEKEYTIWYKYCSSKLGIQLTTSDNKLLYTHLSEWHGTPYLYGGNKIQTGTDCSGFISKIYANVYNLSLPRTAQSMYDYTKKVNHSNLQTGDLLFFRTGKTDRITHVGIYLKDGKFMHASSFHGVTVSNLNKDYYQKRLAGVGRHQDMALLKRKNMSFEEMNIKKVQLISVESTDEETPVSYQIAESTEQFNHFISEQENGIKRSY